MAGKYSAESAGFEPPDLLQSKSFDLRLPIPPISKSPFSIGKITHYNTP